MLFSCHCFDRFWWWWSSWSGWSNGNVGLLYRERWEIGWCTQGAPGAGGIYVHDHTYVCKCICVVDYVWMHDKCTNSLGVHMMVWHMYQLYCLNSAAVQILSELNKSTNSRAGLHLQDFRVAINRSPDFSKYVGYILFIAAVQTAYCLWCYKE